MGNCIQTESSECENCIALTNKINQLQEKLLNQQKYTSQVKTKFFDVYHEMKNELREVTESITQTNTEKSTRRKSY